MSENFEALEGLEVRLDRLVFVPELEAPSDRPFPFVYFLTIRNGSDQRVFIQGRKWVVTELGRDTQVLEGEGVVGEKPDLAPGAEFSYNSYHVCGGPADVSGAYFGHTEFGQAFFVRIPDFKLIPPGFS